MKGMALFGCESHVAKRASGCSSVATAFNEQTLGGTCHTLQDTIQQSQLKSMCSSFPASMLPGMLQERVLHSKQALIKQALFSGSPEAYNLCSGWTHGLFAYTGLKNFTVVIGNLQPVLCVACEPGARRHGLSAIVRHLEGAIPLAGIPTQQA
eukprot:scaffold21387_cov17-Tisochrysis_lutea.AAC.1